MILPLLVACGVDHPAEDGPTDPTGTGCEAVPTALVVTDIDETLTTTDGEWLQQLVDPTHDPAMRPDADVVMTRWHDSGYRIVYLTARGEDLPLSDGRTAREATEDWLAERGFPFATEDVFLAEGAGALGEAAATYKTAVLEEILAEGNAIAQAYGNATTDIEAYQAVGIPDDRIWYVGTTENEDGVRSLSNEDAYTAHLDALGTPICASEFPF